MKTEEKAQKASENRLVENAIEVKNVSKTFRIPHEKISTLKGAFVNAFKSNSFEEFKALDDVSFSVKKGEFFGIIGRNGSGKSTLLKILAGIYQPDKGKIRINGRISPFLELGIGFNPELSGRDNIFLNAAVLGLTHKQINEKFDDIVNFSELRRFIDQKVKNYSSGMQVRLAFSVAIHANRDILLMDEVLAVGDSNFQSKCLDEFNRYKKMGKTVILVSHDIMTVQKYCDRAMLLRQGKNIIVDVSEKVTSRYLLENMNDEEKRISREKKGIKNQDDKRRTATRATVKDVKIYDAESRERKVFMTGEKIAISVKFEITRQIDNPIFGIVIRNFSRQPIFSTNTLFKKIKTGLVEKGYREVAFVIESYFSNGTYFICPAVADKNAAIFYDWKDDAESFKVFNYEYSSNAIVDFNHEIIIS